MAITNRIAMNLYDLYEMSLTLSFNDGSTAPEIEVGETGLRVFSNWEALDAILEGTGTVSVVAGGGGGYDVDISLIWKDRLPKKFEFSPLSLFEDHLIRYKNNPSYAFRSPLRELAKEEGIGKLFYKVSSALVAATSLNDAATNVYAVLKELGFIKEITAPSINITGSAVSLELKRGLHTVAKVAYPLTGDEALILDLLK